MMISISALLTTEVNQSALGFAVCGVICFLTENHPKPFMIIIDVNPNICRLVTYSGFFLLASCLLTLKIPLYMLQVKFLPVNYPHCVTDTRAFFIQFAGGLLFKSTFVPITYCLLNNLE